MLLQTLAWPEPALCSERALYLRTNGPAGVSLSTHRIHFRQGAHIQFDTYFNIFNIGKWHSHCGLDDVGLQLLGTGQVELSVFIAYPNRSWGRLIDEVITLSPDVPRRFDIPLAGHVEPTGVLYFELRALGDGALDWAAWDTRQAPRRDPKLALSVTTFRREEAVAQTVKRFTEFAQKSRLGSRLHMFVVDNGRSADIENSDWVTAIGNENLGGAGGFARGLLAAKDNGFSHCLFMDDDAATPMEAVERTWAFLAYAHDPATAIAGAMISNRHAWALWENGALFHGACRPVFGGTDLRDQAQVFEMEFASTPRNPHNFYGGWWYFAFPLEEVKHLPFPFFVRGDDVSFSLVHDFNIQTLPGVVSFQESFTEKDSPLTWYLDLRSHLAHHLSLPSMEIGRLRVLKMAAWFFLRNLPRMHYDTLAAINLALSDVQKGPEFFDEHADMAQRRADIKALTCHEIWEPAPARIPSERIRRKPRGWLARQIMKVTLNGHLLPFFGRWGDRIVLQAEDRGKVGWTWGAAEITYLSGDEQRAYTVRHSKRLFLREGFRFAVQALTLLWRYPRLLSQYRESYDELTSEAYWRAKLDMTRTDDTA
ncbi:hypothetical protein [Thalassovita aquimarina]|uniref:Galactofuranosyltransferase GlfT2 N-terminal domain-containing protein n=1 Tax=Thalassovita aquimarina TaxID=2785917 RepID=A0ABS5HMB7_9RHOB|nr:hypothetical protein [Thalassovita aquimarina]